MNDAISLRDAKLARVGAFLHGGSILSPSNVAPSSLTQAQHDPQNWTVISSGTGAAYLVYAIVATDPYSAETTRVPTSTATFEVPGSNTVPEYFSLRSMYVEDFSPISARQDQIVKNANAIALLDRWVIEGGGRFDESEARELQELRTALDENRGSSRKLFP